MAIGVAAGVLVGGSVGGYLLARPMSRVVRTEAYQVAAATAEDLADVADLRIFFAHQSVGGNILDATPAVFDAAGLAVPEIVETEDAAAVTGPMIVHAYVGENRDPIGKITEFDRMMRSGMGEAVDVAVLKLCYIDVRDDTDVDEIFDLYSETLAALERDFPDVTFLYVTVPLTTEFGGATQRAKQRIKDLLGRDNLYVPADNVAREELNALIRAEYGATGRLFDIAAIQATDLDGNRRVRSHDGSEYFAMEDVISSNPGHLNSAGGEVIASAFYAAISGGAERA